MSKIPLTCLLFDGRRGNVSTMLDRIKASPREAFLLVLKAETISGILGQQFRLFQHIFGVVDLMQPVVVVIEYKSLPHTSAQALRELSELITTVVAVEPACRGIRLLQDQEDPCRFLLWEDWTDKAEYVGPHMKTPHLVSFIQRAKSVFAGPPTIHFWYTRTEEWPA